MTVLELTLNFAHINTEYSSLIDLREHFNELLQKGRGLNALGNHAYQAKCITTFRKIKKNVIQLFLIKP